MNAADRFVVVADNGAELTKPLPRITAEHFATEYGGNVVSVEEADDEARTISASEWGDR